VIVVHDKTKIFLTGFLVALILVCLFVGLKLFPYVDNFANDQMYYASGLEDKIVLVFISDNTLSKLGGWPIDRNYYAQFIDKVDADVIGIDISFFEQKENDSLLQEKIKEKNVILASELVDGKELKPIFDSGMGYVNVPLESDGISRQIVVSKYNSFAKTICETYTDDICLENGSYLNFKSSEKNFKIYNFEDIVNSNKKYNFSGKIVLLGSNVKNLHDFVNTPLQKEMPGVVYHANYLQNYLNKNFLKNYYYLTFLYCILLLILVFLVGYFIGPKWNAILIWCLVLLSFVLTLLLFEYSYIFSFFYPFVSLVISGGAFYLTDYYFKDVEKKGITNLFSKYVSKNVVSHMLKNPKKYNDFNAERKRVTVLFADIRGFTKMSAAMDSEEVMHTLNTYLDEMTEIIFKHGGTLDKYVGDEIMAVFNSPTEVKDHEKKALECAKDLLAHIAKVNKKTKKNLNYGVGINSGYVVAGSFGSRSRLEYGVLGDTVNLAARLCSSAEANEIVIGQGTYDGLGILEKRGLEKKSYDLKGKGYTAGYVWTKKK